MNMYNEMVKELTVLVFNYLVHVFPISSVVAYIDILSRAIANKDE